MFPRSELSKRMTDFKIMWQKFFIIVMIILLLLDRFMSIGGWSILNKWLVEAKKTENFPVLVELLEVFQKRF